MAILETIILTSKQHNLKTHLQSYLNSGHKYELGEIKVWDEKNKKIIFANELFAQESEKSN